MFKINYPQEKSVFEKEYCAALKLKKSSCIDRILSNLFVKAMSNPNRDIKPINVIKVERLINFFITSEFEFILKCMQEYPKLSKCDKLKLKVFFDYEKKQKNIADFFKENQTLLNIQTCYYCGIDYVNSFNKNNFDCFYFDVNDFKKNSTDKDLSKVDGIGPGKISEYNTGEKTKPELFTKVINSNLEKQLNGVSLGSHFSIDHVIPKSEFPLFALCLYNFVPSCLACNTKFKRLREFDFTDSKVGSVIPSSNNYELTDELSFMLLNASKVLEQCKTTSELAKIPFDSIDFDEIKLSLNFDPSKIHIRKYLGMFKIKSRYDFHLPKIKKLIEKKGKYPDTAIDNMVDLLGIDKNILEKDIFGSDLFPDGLGNDDEKEPLYKLRSDIWKFINKDD